MWILKGIKLGAENGKGPLRVLLQAPDAPSVVQETAGNPNQAGFAAAAGAQVSKGTIKSATMLMILISGFTAGPAVSL